jgi:hypothetical protein
VKSQGGELACISGTLAPAVELAQVTTGTWSPLVGANSRAELWRKEESTAAGWDSMLHERSLISEGWVGKTMPTVTPKQQRVLQQIKAQIKASTAESDKNEEESSAAFNRAFSELEQLADALRRVSADVTRWQPSMEVLRAQIGGFVATDSDRLLFEAANSDWDVLHGTGRRMLGAAEALDNLASELRSLRRRSFDSMRDFDAHLSALVDLIAP